MEKDLEQRTKRFSLAVIESTVSLSRTRAARVLGRQLPRSPTSTGANLSRSQSRRISGTPRDIHHARKKAQRMKAPFLISTF
jgi:hypothetical protein